MTLELTRRPPAEQTTDDLAEPFPYGSSERGLPLPTATARGVLRPTDVTKPVGVAGATNCPDCGNETINGAGLFTCPDCAWTGSLR